MNLSRIYFSTPLGTLFYFLLTAEHFDFACQPKQARDCLSKSATGRYTKIPWRTNAAGAVLHLKLRSVIGGIILFLDTIVANK